ncbi:hypothetical protein HKBW3S25_01937, partial [Candidatus Hakubella thermalkaliphila]
MRRGAPRRMGDFFGGPQKPFYKSIGHTYVLAENKLASGIIGQQLSCLLRVGYVSQENRFTFFREETREK